MYDISDAAAAAGRLAGIDMASLRGLLGPLAADLVVLSCLVVAFLSASLLVAIPAAMGITRAADWIRLHAIRRNMLRPAPLFTEDEDAGRSGRA